MLWPKKEKEEKEQVSTDKGNNGTVSEAVSSAEPPRKMRRNATAMWSRSSSISDDVNHEAEGTERREFQKRKKARGP